MGEFAFWFALTVAVVTVAIIHLPSLFGFVGLLVGLATFGCMVESWGRHHA